MFLFIVMSNLICIQLSAMEHESKIKYRLLVTQDTELQEESEQYFFNRIEQELFSAKLRQSIQSFLLKHPESTETIITHILKYNYCLIGSFDNFKRELQAAAGETHNLESVLRILEFNRFHIEETMATLDRLHKASTPQDWIKLREYARDAVYRGDFSCVLDSRDYNGSTFLLRAVYQDNCEMLMFLLCRGANLNSADISGMTPLLLAVRLGHEEMVEELLVPQYNVDLTAVTSEGHTAMDLARLHDHKAIQLLLDKVSADRCCYRCVML